MSQTSSERFHFCPQCGRSRADVGGNPLACADCGFKHYFGPAVAVGAIILDSQDRILFLRRARDPGKGKLGLPGGFVDLNESGEEAAAREIFEEVGLRVASTKYLTTFVNSYCYLGTDIPVLDLFYICKVDSFASLAAAPDEVKQVEFLIPSKPHLDDMAFASNRRAVEFFIAHRGEETG